MTGQNYIFDITPQSFNAMVLENSIKGPVLLYHWSEHAAPCMKLLPRLVKLADDYGGRFLLMLIDTDRFKNFSNDQGVISIPTVQVYFREKIIDTIHGAYSEKHFRSAIEKALPRPRHALISGSSERSRFRAQLDKAKRWVENGEVLKAAAILDKLPAQAMQDPEIELLYTHLDMIRMAQLAPDLKTLQKNLIENPDDAEVKFKMAARHLVNDEFDAALQTLTSLRESENHRVKSRAIRSTMAIFALLGESHPLVKKHQFPTNKSMEKFIGNQNKYAGR
ncbi:tetratricopeptide repeat protein [Candidatus Spongiihabitans sp.]|uniref:tetratricopeptide repeat protein n=1 Tax=Candidatus Spongiihabitans sp. TaxID=3101308 RepID=UPI003C79B589